ncbi:MULTISPECIES: dynamin family protein [Streptomyces]|uniref:Dynamin family protein n=1 Tax=Streptomyces caniscabiei TaxID=2746961 RepID=A0ABU4MNJ1_9ACTN|nr:MULTISPECIES: dynamin family protein [Streptomyces]MBE4734419.1 dynamin family protein [Streptomyces caniscabiei]MBE4755290.1 dynamin family protein [Streptomyces caniscabiei]MBE4771370.1 dynamin family protein [Streptomyces caniscabiei]MBE4783425.1 dynamin family protein [Streptomyces caniscabiei]MBE4792729.1 dynamin family protein [Streptomyces caniscabiei]
MAAPSHDHVFTRIARAIDPPNPAGPADPLDLITANLRAVVTAARARMGQPMRVAVAGQIKRGKSTLVNALLGEEVSDTGQLELTFNVCEFHHSPHPRLLVHFKDGRAPEEWHPETLSRLTVRSADGLSLLRAVRKVEVGRPSPLLRRFRLVDTPGLGSVHGTDAENTLAFLGIDDPAERAETARVLAELGHDARSVHAESAAEMDRADAVVFVFSRGLGRADQQAVESFAGSYGEVVSPLKAFGVLSRSDQYWPPVGETGRDGMPLEPADYHAYDPMATARRIADTYLERPLVRRVFRTVVPVAGLLGVGAQCLPGDGFGPLADLATVEPPLLAERMEDVHLFCARDHPDLPVPPEVRAALVSRLGAWGTFLACGYLRAGLTEAEVRRRLLEHSGVTELRSLVLRHFGNRAALIKLDHGQREIADEVARLRATAQRAGRQPPPVADRVAGLLESARVSDPGPSELAALGAHYRGRLSLTAEEEAQLLAVTGERGTGCAARLALPPGTPVDVLLTTARERAAHWAARAGDPLLDRPTLMVARVVLRSYERVADLVDRAGALLYGDDEEQAGHHGERSAR